MPQELTTLEIVLLLLARDGVNTPYLLKRDGKISFGSSVPALRRMTEMKLLRRAGEGARRKAEYQLTTLGQRTLGQSIDTLFREGKARGIEELIRLWVIALAVGRGESAALVLARAAKAKRRDVEVQRGNSLTESIPQRAARSRIFMHKSWICSV